MRRDKNGRSCIVIRGSRDSTVCFTAAGVQTKLGPQQTGMPALAGMTKFQGSFSETAVRRARRDDIFL